MNFENGVSIKFMERTMPPRNCRPLTTKQTVFVREYLIDLNATQAAIRAGYSAKNADKIGTELLGKTRVAEAIQAGMDKRVRRLDLSADMTLQETAKIAFSDVRDLFNEHGHLKSISTLPDHVARAISSVEVVTRRLPGEEDGAVEVEYIHKIKFWDKTKTLELLGKHQKLFKDTVNLNILAGISDVELEEMEEKMAWEIAVRKGWVKAS